MPAIYDTIGLNYARLRRADPSIERAIHDALGDAETVVNVGAGAGSYEPADRPVVAVELSATMIRQRPPGAAPAVQANAMASLFVRERLQSPEAADAAFAAFAETDQLLRAS